MKQTNAKRPVDNLQNPMARMSSQKCKGLSESGRELVGEGMRHIQSSQRGSEALGGAALILGGGVAWSIAKVWPGVNAALNWGALR